MRRRAVRYSLSAMPLSFYEFSVFTLFDITEFDSAESVEAKVPKLATAE